MTEQELQSLPGHVQAVLRQQQMELERARQLRAAQEAMAQQRTNDSAARSIGAVLGVADETPQTAAAAHDENPAKGDGAAGEDLTLRAQIDALTPKDGKMTARLTVSRRLYLEARRTARGVSRRWWYRVPKNPTRGESRLALGAYPQTSVSRAKEKAAKLLADDARGKDVAAVRTGRPVAGASDAFRAGFVDGFREAAPACYDFAKDSEAATPWAAPWTWAKVQEWSLPGLTAAEQGRAWADKCRAEMLRAFARGE